jgi:hypothetical protein
MATTANGTPYVESSDLVANYPAVSLALAEHIDDIGKILQIVSGTATTTVTITTSTVTDSGLSATITPSSITSKILVMVNQMTQLSRAGTSGDLGACRVQIFRDSTSIWSSGANRWGSMGTASSTNPYKNTHAGLIYLDSPASTSALTYKTRGDTNPNYTMSFNTIDGAASTSQIVLIEVAA